jgi:hypothetical protein
MKPPRPVRAAPVRRAARARRVPLILLSLCALTLPLPGCSTTREAYYNAWERFGGYAKRERLVDNVKEARTEQVEAKEQFADALQQFKSVAVNFDGGDLEKVYNKLNGEYQDAEKQAGQVRDKITGVKRVATALFDEWKGEIAEIKDDPALQRQSRELLDQTRANYDQMIRRMDAASASMDPVLAKFKSRVLYLKHSLNAQAIASLRGIEVELGDDIDALVRQMEASIAEADQFISQMDAGKGS